MRYDENGKKNVDFILNKEPYNKSKILLAGKILDVAHLESMPHGLFLILVLSVL